MTLEYNGAAPEIDETAYVSENAVIAGNVRIGPRSAAWFGAAIRGDDDMITIGSCSNIQDNATVHCDAGYPVKIGDYVTVGHNAIIHGCTIEDRVIIGMGAIVMDGAVVGTGSIIGAGALVKAGAVIPAGSVAVGSPAKVVKQVSEAQAGTIVKNAEIYMELAENYKRARK